MTRLTPWVRCAVVGLCLLLPWQARPTAAQSAVRCESQPLSVETLTQASEMAARLHQSLESQRLNVVIIARIGEDISDRGLKYTVNICQKMFFRSIST